MSDTTKYLPDLKVSVDEKDPGLIHVRGKSYAGAIRVGHAECAATIASACNSHQALVDALQMAKHIVAQEGTDEQAEQVFRALELAGVKP